MTGLVPWGADRIEEIADLLLRCSPDEDLTPDEILTSCHEQSGIVMAADDGGAIVAVGTGRDVDGSLISSVRLLAVDPDVQRSGRGSELLEHAERWSIDRGASRIFIGGSLPFSLWPGVAEGSAMAALAASRGFEIESEWDSCSVPVSYRFDAPAGVAIRRAVRDDDVMLVVLAASAKWPRLSDEVARALEHGTCHVAISTIDGDDAVVGVGCHSITRAGWAGPLLVDEYWRRRGVGRALLGQVCRDLMIAEFPHVVVPEVPDERAVAFLQAVEAKSTVRYRRMVKRLD